MKKVTDRSWRDGDRPQGPVSSFTSLARAVARCATLSVWSRKMSSVLVGTPGHSHPALVHFVHIGLVRSHCDWLQWMVFPFGSFGVYTLTFRFLHVPQPRLGLPELTISDPVTRLIWDSSSKQGFFDVFACLAKTSCPIEEVFIYFSIMLHL